MSIVIETLAILGAPAVALGWIALIAHRRGDGDTRRAAVRLLCQLLAIIALALAVIAAVMLAAGMALAFPEMVRHGYDSCGACHQAEGGAGILTGYGRSAGPPLTSTWSARGEETPTFGLGPEPPGWLFVAGDVRSVAVRSDTPGDAGRFIPMQADAELAVEPVSGLILGAGLGSYGPQRERETRRVEARLGGFGGAAALRIGRFAPAFGLAVADHRIPTRAALGLGEGGEVWAAEATLRGELGDVVATAIAGARARLDLGGPGGSALTSDEPSGGAVRSCAFLAGRGQACASILRLRSPAGARREAFGGHVALAPLPWLWLLAEADRRFDGASARDLAFARAGVEPWRGVELALIATRDGPGLGGGGQVVWMPRPHLEFVVEATRDRADPAADPVDMALLLSHFYL